MSRLDLSVVVTARNRAESLPVLLGRLEQQTMPPARFEIVVVDCGSTDGTADHALRYARGAPVRITVVDRRNRILTIRNLHLEPGVRPTSALATAISGALWNFEAAGSQFHFAFEPPRPTPKRPPFASAQSPCRGCQSVPVNASERSSPVLTRTRQSSPRRKSALPEPLW